MGAIAQSIEVPLIFGRQAPHPLCAHEVYFNAQSLLDFRPPPNPMRAGMPPSLLPALPRSLYRQALAVHVLEIATKASGDQPVRRAST
jgi:hypothetical protein